MVVWAVRAPHTHAGGIDGRGDEMERARVKRRKISVTMYQMSGCLYGYLLRGRPGAPRGVGRAQVTGAPVTKGRRLRCSFLASDTLL